MIRAFLVIGGIFCASVLAAETIGLGLLWFSGSLTSDTLRDIRLVLQGETPEEEPLETGRDAASRYAVAQ